MEAGRVPDMTLSQSGLDCIAPLLQYDSGGVKDFLCIKFAQVARSYILRYFQGVILDPKSNEIRLGS